MKKYIFTLVPLLLLAFSCKKEEKGFISEGEPYFSIEVLDDKDVTQANLDEMSAQYTLPMGANGYSLSASANDHINKAYRFHVKSNQRWKIVSAEDEAPSWVHPFPAYGEKDGIFFFKTDRNIDPQNSREAYYNIYIDNGSDSWQLLDGMLTVRQDISPEFLELSAAKFDVEAPGQTVRLRVLANVDWNYELLPIEEYATENLDWITDNSTHESTKQIDTLVLKVAANDSGIRGAGIRIKYTAGGKESTELIPITQYPATEANLEGFPVKWVVNVADQVNFDSTFPSEGTIMPVSGSGLITFNNECGKAADKNGKVLLDLHDYCPRATGVWPGDYCEFAAYSPVSKGTIVKLVFGTRVSGTGHKYWRLEYRDGEEWKVAGKTYTDEAVMGPDNQPVVYTHAMNSDGATNILVDATVIYANNTDQVEFRFICAANYQANDKGPLSAPNGGTWRLAVNEKTADNAYQPQISIIAAGSEVLTPANLSVAPAYLTFDGKPTAGKTFTVTSNQDFTLTANQSWIHLSAETSEVGENLPFTVTCDNNTESTIREGSITVKAGITRRDIAIIQGAAGSSETAPQELEPLISIIGGNAIDIPGESGSITVGVQANVQVNASSDEDWISIAAAPSTKAAVDVTNYIITFSANPSTDSSRQGYVYFSNTSENLTAVLRLTQAEGSGDDSTGFPVVWSYPEPSSSWKAGTDFDVSNNVTGSYVWSDMHTGKLSVNRDAATVAPASASTYKVESATFASKVWLKQDAMQKGCYWLFEVFNVKRPAGTYTFKFRTCASASGPKCFLMQYSIDGGSSWTDINPKTEDFYYSDDTNKANPLSIKHTYWVHSGNTLEDIEQSFTLDQPFEGTLKVRIVVAEDLRASLNHSIDKAGTNRFGDYARIEFQKK